MKKSRKAKTGNVVTFIPTGEYYYEKALGELKKEQFTRAQKYLKRAVELSPEDPLILMQYGILLMEAEQFDEAQELLYTAHTMDPSDSEIVFFLAEIHAHLGMFAEANRYATKYLEIDSDGPYLEEAMEILDFTEYDGGGEFAEGAPSSDVVFMQEKARKMMERGRFEEAVALLETIVAENDTFWPAFNNLALAYFYIGEEEQATALLHEVLRSDQGNLHALCNLAVLAHYKEAHEELNEVTAVLVKIKPIAIDQRFKLGATFALLGKHEEGYRILRQLQKMGFGEDPSFYFWLAHSAFFSGKKDRAHQAWLELIRLDPTKDGFEPWKLREEEELSGLENDKDFLVDKLQSDSAPSRAVALYMMGKSVHLHDLVAHPKLIDVAELSAFEKLIVGYSLNHEFSMKVPVEKSFVQAMKVADLFYQHHSPLTYQHAYMYEMWFVMMERGLQQGYSFKNTKALAAATAYMYASSRSKDATKKQFAEHYEVSVPTLTKYVNELMAFFPFFDA
ncbi:tetratricopeptide repeat protein [Chryseomicrobium sp. FSL W7-1435]|uniref:tetratricopeptide repeat protein n=1 Tax=Chryseomicrobium sp. FSL W7-1435 TaxID=2921704 RepID=UPI00315A6104